MLPVSFTSMFGVTLLLSCLTLLVTALGFRKIVYFVSIGYAFSIVGMVLITLLAYYQQISLLALAQNILLAVWGLRLGVFLVRRELQPSFQGQARQAEQEYGGVSLPKKLVIWLGVSLLYVLMFSPALFSAYGAPQGVLTSGLLAQWVGLLVMGAGLLIETLADRQKSQFKARFPRAFCNVGLYRWVRCPNYLGEILFWVGNWIMGIAFYTSPLHWLASLAGTVVLVLIMLGSTRRLERAQESRYGSEEAYQVYIRTVKVLFPFVPLYSLKNIRVYLE